VNIEVGEQLAVPECELAVPQSFVFLCLLNNKRLRLPVQVGVKVVGY
jgi:hypothetical protein